METTREQRIEALARVTMPHGIGKRVPNGEPGRLCVMECVAYVAGEALTDAPACASPALRSLAVKINDGAWWDSDAERTVALLPLVVLLAGSRDASRELARIKAIYAWAVALRYEITPPRAETAAKRLEKSWPEHAAKIRAAAEVLRAQPSADNARALRDVCRSAAAAAAAAAADAAAYAAADAAYAAADAAAAAAAADAAADAAAAAAAAYAAADDAAAAAAAAYAAADAAAYADADADAAYAYAAARRVLLRAHRDSLLALLRGLLGETA